MESIDLLVLIQVVLCSTVISVWLWKIRVRSSVNAKLFHLHKWRCLAVLLLVFAQIMELIECTMERVPSSISICSQSGACLYTVFLTFLVRQIETKGFAGQSLYGVIVMNGLLLILKAIKWFWILSADEELSSQSEPLFYFIGTVVVALIMINVIDVMTALVEKEPRFRFRDKSPVTNHLNNKIYSHFLSQITFSWITPLLWFGYSKRRLEMGNLGTLSEGDMCRVQYDLFQLNYKACGKSLWRCYFKSHRKFILLGGFLKLIGDCLILVGPISISYVLNYLTKIGEANRSPGNDTIETFTSAESVNGTIAVQWEDFASNGYFWAFLIFVSICAQSVVSQCSTHLINMVGISIRNSLQGLIYRKALSISLWGKDTWKEEKEAPAFDVGMFTNLMVDDSFNVMSFFWLIHLIWAIPLKITLVLILLYLELGWSAVIGAVAMMLCLVPLQFVIGKCMSSNMNKISTHSDERLKLINEVLRSIKVIKLNCWESVFAKKINSIREKELNFFRIDSFYWTLISILIQIASGLLILTTLIIHFYGSNEDDESDSPPNVSQIITCLALFNHLTIALFIFPLTVPVILSAIISTNRLQQFLSVPEVPSKNIGIQTIARILSRSDTHSDLIEDGQSIGTPDCSGDERSDKMESMSSARVKVFVSRDPWAVKIGKLKFKGTGHELLGFDIRIPKYSVTAIIGPSGSGKTAFLSAILGEIPDISGDIQWDKCATTSFVPQTPWLISSTIRENITFGEQFRTMQYKKIIEFCELQQDLDALSAKGDETEVGDNGTELSGGQQQRVAIARALYAPANVILMDDPFSALDDQVTHSIFNKAIKNLAMNKKRTIIMTTQNMNIASQADFIIIMDKRRVAFAGSGQEVKENEKYSSLFGPSSESTDGRRGSAARPWGLTRTASEHWTLLRNIRKLRPFNLCDSFEEASRRRSIKRNSLFGSRHLTYEIPLPMDEYNDPDIVRVGSSFYSKSGVGSSQAQPQNSQRTMSLCIDPNQVVKSVVVRNISSPPAIPGTSQKRFSLRSSFSRLTGRTDSLRSNKGHSRCEDTILETNEATPRASNDEASVAGEAKLDQVDSETEDLMKKSSVAVEQEDQLNFWLFYFKRCGWMLIFVFSISSCFYQSLKIYSDMWLSEVVEENDDTRELRPQFNSYIILNVLCILVAVLSVPFGQYAGHRAKRSIHEGLVKTLLVLPVEQINIGQFIHRFANDVCVVDKKICPTSFRLLQFVILWVSAILINTYIVPWFLFVTVSLALLYFFIQRFFSAPLNALQKLESQTWEPIIANFAETLKGLVTIRAFNQESVFMDRFFNKLEANNVTFVMINAANRFLGVVLDVLGGFIVMISILSALLSFDAIHSDSDVKIIGMAINYTLMVPIYMNWIVKLLADMEKYMDAIRRIKGDVAVLQQIPEIVTIDKYLVPISWPQNGEIVFDNVSLHHKVRTASNGPVLVDINVTIPAGQKIGICGRTGSGKSSFVSSLFGALDVTKGRILIDDVDIASIPLEELRTRLAIISQNVALFTGTLRDNVDPCGIHTEDEIVDALRIAQLNNLLLFGMGHFGYGLEMKVVSDGANLSQGQRQLVSLARAILRSPVLLVLDEATSSLDVATEKKLLDAAVDAFQGRTIITVAHRLHTLAYFDRILVFDKGRIVRDGPASEIIPTLDAKTFD